MQAGEDSDLIPILDACCGSRKFWFNKNAKGVLFMDKRSLRASVTDRSKAKHDGKRWIEISPDVVGDFREMPFADDTFNLVVFDPPHMKANRTGKLGWMATAYGTLSDDWREDLRRGFSECFRVLRPFGVLVFKWAETNIKLSEVVALSGRQPLFGNRMPKLSGTHWLVFMKQNQQIEQVCQT